MDHTATQADERDIEALMEFLPVSILDEVLTRVAALAAMPGRARSECVPRLRGGRNRCGYHDHPEGTARCRDIDFE